MNAQQKNAEYMKYMLFLGKFGTDNCKNGERIR